MTKISNLKSFNFGLQALGVEPHIIHEWNKTLIAFNNKHLKIIEFNPSAKEHEHWALILESKFRKDKGKIPDLTKFNRIINKNFKRAFTTLTSNHFTSEYWTNLSSKIFFSGFYIPLSDIKNSDPEVLRSHLNFNHLRLKYYRYEDFFTTLKKQKRTLNKNQDLTPYVIWFYIYYYTRFLYYLKERFPYLHGLYGNWFSEHLDMNNFHRRLPSEQVTILLLNLCEAISSNTKQEWRKRRIYGKGSSSVSSFFQKYQTNLELIFGELDNELNQNTIQKPHVKIKKEFAELFLLDSNELFVQDILDDQSGFNLSRDLPIRLKVKYGPTSLYNLSNIVKDTIFAEDKLPAGYFKEDSPVLPKCYRKKQNIYIDNVQYWYDLMPDEKKEIIDVLNENLPNYLLEKVDQLVEEKRQTHLMDLVNLITTPFLTWHRENNNLYPKWNLFENDEASDLRKTFKQSKKEIEAEKKILEEHLKAIFQLETKHELDSYIEKHNPIFNYDKFQSKWEAELNRIMTRVIQKKKYFDIRMKEFGISDSNLNENFKNIWLKEMLAIEEEVKPFISYVKQAFQTALPVRRKINFSQDRHVSDGVEFDPNTLFDQEKWIRADVMKVMESKIEKGEAIQINTFCLDYSGSMKHERMRNLYKVLYLLVLGLEDRKSFDAFHFFSNNFIEVVNFSNEFTSRKILFKIMQQISDLQQGQVQYFGLGATNISDGIAKSHEKMMNFIKEFRKVNPKANIVTSMFVITDGVPSVGITDIPLLNEFIEDKRKDGDVEIKGIFIKSEDDISPNFMLEIFGENNFIETTNFREGVDKFVKIMTETYKQQRKTYKWKQKKRKLGLTD